MHRREVVAGVAALLVIACSDNTGTGPHSGAATLVATSGSGQFSAPGTVLAQPIVVTLSDSTGAPKSGALVTWSASGNGLIWPASSTTDAGGHAQAHWALGDAAGAQQGTAKSSGATDAQISAQATGVPSLHFIYEDDSGIGHCVGSDVGLAFYVQDAAGVPKSGMTVNWTVLLGTGTLGTIPPPSTTTDTRGGAYNAYLTAAAPERAVVLVWSSGMRPIQYVVASASPCPIFAVATGDRQTATAGTTLPDPIRIIVDNDSGVAVGRAVSWSVISGGGSLSGAATVTSVLGFAVASWTLGLTPGTQSIQASVAGISTPVIVTATALDPSAAPTLVATVPASGATYYHDTFVRDGLAFSFEWNKGVLIYDVGNGMKGGSPSNPQLVSQLITSDNGFAGGPAVHNGWWFQNPVTGEKRYLFVGQEGPLTVGSTSSGDIHIVDVSDLANPHEVGFIHVAGAGTHNFWMDEANQILYAAYYNGGVIKVDVSGTLSGDMSNRIVAHVLPGGPGHTYVWGVMLSNGTLYASDFLSGLWALDPATLATKGGGNNLPLHGPGSDLWVDGQYGYTGDWGNADAGAWVNVWSLDANGTPTIANSMMVPGDANTLSDVAVSPNGKMLVATVEGGSGSGLYVWDRVDPAHPQLRGKYLVAEGLHTGEVKEVNGRTYVFAARDPSAQALMIFDITNIVH